MKKIILLVCTAFFAIQSYAQTPTLTGDAKRAFDKSMAVLRPYCQNLKPISFDRLILSLESAQTKKLHLMNENKNDAAKLADFMTAVNAEKVFIIKSMIGEDLFKTIPSSELEIILN